MHNQVLEPLRLDIIENWIPNIVLFGVIVVILLYLPHVFAYYAVLFITMVIVICIALYYAFKLPPPSNRFNREYLASSIYGHRGCVDINNIDELTKEAFEYAYNANAQGIECDLRLTKDLEPIIIHDYHIGNFINNDRRQCMAKTNVHELTLKELKEIELKGHKQSRFMSLEDLVDFMNDHIYAKNSNQKAFFCLLLEFKKPCCNRFDDKILKKIMFTMHKISYLNERVIFISFLPNIIYRFRRMFNDINIGLLYERHLIFSCLTLYTDTHMARRDLNVKALYRFVDPFFTFLCQFVVPYFCGCICIGVPSELVSKHLMQHYAQNNISVFSWGAHKAVDIEWLLSNTVSVLLNDPIKCADSPYVMNEYLSHSK